MPCGVEGTSIFMSSLSDGFCMVIERSADFRVALISRHTMFGLLVV
jgi:hypothetical protein